MTVTVQVDGIDVAVTLTVTGEQWDSGVVSDSIAEATAKVLAAWKAQP